MNIFILTNDFYMFNGIKHALSDRLAYNCVQVDPSSPYNAFLFFCASKEDVFVLLPDFYKLSFDVLLGLNNSKASVIITKTESTSILGLIFQYQLIPKKFYLSDLLQAIHFKYSEAKVANIPKLTGREKDILLFTVKGISISSMSRSLDICIKTAYQHQRNALKKIGIQRACNIFQLPDNLISYLCTYH
ncbi:hypothetical protein FH968_10760 [Buttiauxella sp. B2]|uniref:LuxR C-terminal-related transcriptional regulator n=1 Tax=Buttiauxella sp. B2 TaxID=2587812 RepID=UPI00112308CB|nr:LuxR C-terminal-related transcriptional regulator [Buttiauxella sp. B2]TNV20475.1 hypothetical protein FH968_10760 [Buttiauxella sp. B2]